MMRRTLPTLLFTLAAFHLPAQTALDDHCVVTILNRAAQVRSDGTWMLPNVPSNLGAVRARVACTENGVTRIGTTPYFSIPTQGGAFTNDFTFAATTNVPTVIALTAPKTTMSVGATMQLQAIATYADASTADVTLATRGTQYASTNSAVVSVSADGVVTANATGVVIISAVNDSVLALVRISVGGALIDSDGDGMPDDWEIANGLNPNDPSDAALDPDGDGLTNLQEYQLGTNPHKYDTDGDGIGDGLEVRTGTDPLDPNSYDLAHTLRSIQVVPSPQMNLILEANLSAGSARLRVQGVLLDGHPIDLTTGHRTTYSSADPSIATVTPDGEVDASTAGTTTINISNINANYSAVLPVSVTFFTPRNLFGTNLPAMPQALAVAKSFAFIMTADGMLSVLQVDMAQPPQVVGTVAVPGYANGPIHVSGTSAYVADAGGVTVVDISVPNVPVVKTHDAVTGGVREFAKINGFIVAITPDSLVILNDAGATVSVLPIADPRSIDVSINGVIAIVDGGGVLRVVRGSPSFTTPAVQGSVQLSGIAKVRMWGDFAYVNSTAGLTIIDVGVPTPTIVSSSLAVMSVVDVRDGFAFGGVALDRSTTGVPAGVLIADVGDPATPLAKSTLLSSAPVVGVVADQRYVYSITANPPDAQSYLFTVAQYFASTEANDAPPSVRIASPADGSTVTEGSLVPIAIAATDDGMLDSFSLYANAPAAADDLFTSTKDRPATIRYRVPVGATTLRLKATATDFGANTSTSSAITLNVVKAPPDTTPPTITLTAPLDGTAIIGSQQIHVTANAADDRGVASVQFYANGQPIGFPITYSPYAVTTSVTADTTYFVQPGASSVVFTAQATDAAGNSTMSSPATITTNQGPTAKITSPTSGVGLYAGADINVTVDVTSAVAIRRVDVYVDGRYSNSAYGAPYVVPVTLTPGNASPQLSARAYDISQQVGTSPTVTLNVNPTTVISAVPLPNSPLGIALSGTNAVIACGSAGVVVADISQPASAAVIGTLATPDLAMGIATAGHYAFVADLTAGLIVVDIADPQHPQIAGSLPLNSGATTVILKGDRAYVTSETGVSIIDIRNPRVPRLVGTIPVVRARAVRMVGNLAYIVHDHDTSCSFCNSFQIVDVSSETAPVTLGSLVIDSNSSDLTGLVVENGVAYVSGISYIDAIDVSNPASPRTIGAFDQVNFVHCCWAQIYKHGTLLFAARDEANGIGMLDLRNPANLSVIGQIDFSAVTPLNTLDVAVTPELVFATGNTVYNRPVNLKRTIPGYLAIGRWNTVHDTAGSAPHVVISAPLSGVNVFERQTLFVNVDATDDVDVAAVNLFVDGQLVGMQTAPPFTFAWDVPAGNAQHTLTASAVDFGGNAAVSPAVIVNVLRDTTPPIVRLVAPTPGSSVIGPTIMVRADAQDDFSVASVTLSVNGAAIATLTSPPYEIPYTIPDGVTSFTVSASATDPAGNVSAPVTAQATVMPGQVVGTLPLPAVARRVAVNGSYVYVAATGGSAGLYVIDISNPAQPTIAASLTLPNGEGGRDIRLNGSHAYVTSGQALYEIDISIPSSPRITRSDVNPESSVDITGTRAYAVGGGLRILDLRDPAAFAPIDAGAQIVGSYVRAAGTFAVVNTDAQGVIFIVDTTQPLSTRPIVGTISQNDGTPFMRGALNAFALTGGRLLIPRGFLTGTGPVASTLLVGTGVPTPANLLNVAADAGGLFCVADAGDIAATSGYTGLFSFYDVGDRAKPALVGEVPVSDAITSIALTPTLAIGTSGDDTTSASTLYVAQYRLFTDTAGVAPAVTVSALSDAAAGKFMTIRAVATDDVAVAAVTFTVNGTDVFTSTVAPYEFNYAVPAGTTSLTISARATDFGGNIGRSNDVTVPVSTGALRFFRDDVPARLWAGFFEHVGLQR